MSEEEKKRQRIHDLPNTETKSPPKKDFRNKRKSFMASIKAQTLTLLTKRRFRKQNKCKFPSKYWFA